MNSLTFLDELLDVPVEAEPVAFTPQTHSGGVIAALTLVCGARTEQLPPLA